ELTLQKRPADKSVLIVKHAPYLAHDGEGVYPPNFAVSRAKSSRKKSILHPPHRPYHGSHPMNATASSDPIRHAPLALWRAAQAVLGVLHMLFGAPETVAAKHTLTGKAHAHMASWLRSAEAMLRRLLLIEASAYPKPNTRP